jgi:hypothetical protein
MTVFDLLVLYLAFLLVVGIVVVLVVTSDAKPGDPP